MKSKENDAQDEPILVSKLKKGDAFRVDGDVKKDTYYFIKIDKSYATVTENVESMDAFSEWHYISIKTKVHRVDE